MKFAKRIAATVLAGSIAIAVGTGAVAQPDLSLTATLPCQGTPLAPFAKAPGGVTGAGQFRCRPERKPVFFYVELQEQPFVSGTGTAPWLPITDNKIYKKTGFRQGTRRLLSTLTLQCNHMKYRTKVLVNVGGIRKPGKFFPTGGRNVTRFSKVVVLC